MGAWPLNAIDVYIDANEIVTGVEGWLDSKVYEAEDPKTGLAELRSYTTSAKDAKVEVIAYLTDLLSQVHDIEVDES